MSKEKVIMKDEITQTEVLNTTTSSKGSHHSSPKSTEPVGDKKLVQVEHSHQKAQAYLENNSESLDYAIVKQVYEILDKAIYSTSSFRDSIIKAIGKVQEIELKTDNEKQVVMLGLLENFYNKCSVLSEEREAEDTFIGALSYVHENKELQGFVEDIYADYFE
jgi:hypothetical protein